MRLRQRTPQPDAVDELVPPEGDLRPYTRQGPFKGQRGFKRAGAGFLKHAIDKGLQPHHRVLDLGCGVGRFAVAVSEYLDESGRYVGLDAEQDAVRICNQWIGTKRPQLTFIWADVFNSDYNPEGEARAARYKLPFENSSFDFVFSNSLFTHLVPDDARNYFHEIGRVLRPGGRTLNTIFLLNDESLALVGDGASKHGVLHDLDSVAKVKDPEKPEVWVGFEEDFVREAHTEGGLRIEDVRYGAWSGRDASGPGFGRKDIIVAVKDRRTT